MTRVFDVSLPISPDLAAFPGNPGPRIRPTQRVRDGAATNLSEVQLGSHTGTHVDAPAHLFEAGAGAHALPLDVLIGAAVVADAGAVETLIRPADLMALDLARGTSRLLLRTRNSSFWQEPSRAYPTDYVALAPEAATWLVERGVRLVGTDALSIEPFGASGRPTHRTLLEAGVVIVEGLDLQAIAPGRYTLVCLPLRLMGADGSPARVVLLDEGGAIA